MNAPVRPALAQISIELGQYAGGPQWPVDAGLGDGEDRVAQVRLEQDAGVEEDGEQESPVVGR